VAEPSFKFRSWLNFAGHAAWCRLMASRMETAAMGQTTPEQTLLSSDVHHDSFLNTLEAECTHQRRREVLPRVQSSADPADWETFYGVVLQGIPETEVALQLCDTSPSVRAAVVRVYRTLEQQLNLLEELF